MRWPTMARRSRPGRSWSFWWPCPHCKTERDFLVNEIVGQELAAVARCQVCTRLLGVTEEHRDRETDLKVTRYGLDR